MKTIICVSILPENSGSLLVVRWINISPESYLSADRLWILTSTANTMGIFYKFTICLPITQPLVVQIGERLLKAHTACRCLTCPVFPRWRLPTLTPCGHTGILAGDCWQFHSCTPSCACSWEFGELEVHRLSSQAGEAYWPFSHLPCVPFFC